ncbi:unnamed protein product, partial [Brachionus calyciflorus]
MCDLSLATIHARLEVFARGESFGEYALRVFKLSKYEIEHSITDLIWIGSCNSHTMHRFVLSLRRTVDFKEIKDMDFAIRCFTLLVNCRDLKKFDEIWELLCIVFLSKVKTNEFQEAFEKLSYYIERRPKLCSNSEKLISNSRLDGLPSSQNEKTDEDENETDDIYTEKDKKGQTIAENSPFTSHCEQIKQKLILRLESANEVENNIFNENYIRFLSKNFIPYAFIWSGFDYRVLNMGENASISRLTNGTIEKFFGTRKRLIQSLEFPAAYVNKTYTEWSKIELNHTKQEKDDIIN